MLQQRVAVPLSWLAWLVVPPLCGLLALLTSVGVRPGNFDDSLILFVYVRHLLQSGRFYWNIEEGNVDGFTSVLDLYVKAGAALVWRGDIIRSSWLINNGLHIACGVFGAGLALLWHRRMGGGLLSLFAACVGGLAIATNPAIASGSAFLLETPLYVFTVILALCALLFTTPQRIVERIGLAVSWLLLALARPEGAPLVATFALAYVAWNRRQFGLRVLAQPLLIFGIVYLAYLAWHTWTFGHWAPNTYYAKLSDRRWNEIQDGYAYLRAFATEPRGKLALGWCALAPLCLLWRWRAGFARWAFAALCGATLLSFAVVLWSGGDCYLGDRFLATPVSLALSSALLAAVGLFGFRALLPIALLAAMVFYQKGAAPNVVRRQLVALKSWSVSETHFVRHRTVVQKLERAGLRLAVQNNFQMYKYFSDATRVLDATGLNDSRVAHMPWPKQNLWGKDGWDLLFRERPEVVSYGFHIWSETPMSEYTTQQIATNAELYWRFAGYPLHAGLLANYRSASVSDDRGLFLSIFIREDLVETARAAGILVANR